MVALIDYHTLSRSHGVLGAKDKMQIPARSIRGPIGHPIADGPPLTAVRLVVKPNPSRSSSAVTTDAHRQVPPDPRATEILRRTSISPKAPQACKTDQLDLNMQQLRDTRQKASVGRNSQLLADWQPERRAARQNVQWMEECPALPQRSAKPTSPVR